MTPMFHLNQTFLNFLWSRTYQMNRTFLMSQNYQ